MAVKNRLEAGDVLEFVPHTRRAPLLLRIYRFEDIANGCVTAEDGINAGRKPIIRIPLEWFHEETDIRQLRKDFPAYTVVRREKALTDDAWARLALDRAAQAVETGKGGEAVYRQKQQELIEALDTRNKDATFRRPRLGVEGCCGRGCNGCLHFWNDDRYARARELLRSKKQGALLSNEEVLQIKDV